MEKERFKQHEKHKHLYFSNMGRVKVVKDGEVEIVTKFYKMPRKTNCYIPVRNPNGKQAYVNVAVEIIRLFLDDTLKSARWIVFKDGNPDNLKLSNMEISRTFNRGVRYTEQQPKPKDNIFLASNGIWGVKMWNNPHKVVFRCNDYKDAVTFNKWQENKTIAEVREYPKPETSTPKPNIHLCEIKDQFRGQLTPYMNPLNISQYARK